MWLNAFNYFFKNFKNLYKFFWFFSQGHKEYYLKLDGYYYCSKKESFFVIIKIRNKRIIDKYLLKDIMNDKEYLKELHPVDACIIGLLANHERNNFLKKNSKGIQKIPSFKNGCCFIKSEIILYIYKKYFNEKGLEISVIRSKHFEKEIEIPTVELYKNYDLLYGLGTFQAISVGYSISEFLAKNIK